MVRDENSVSLDAEDIGDYSTIPRLWALPGRLRNLLERGVIAAIHEAVAPVNEVMPNIQLQCLIQQINCSRAIAERTGNQGTIQHI